MADNRMFLTHYLSGKSIGIAKRYGDGWCVYDGIENDLKKFFKHIHLEGDEDDIVIAMEISNCEYTLTDWVYTFEKDENEFSILKIYNKED